MPKVLKSVKKSDKSYSKAVLYSFSVIKGLLIFIIGIAVLSLTVLKNNSSSYVFYCFAYLIIGLGAFASGFFAHKKLHGRGFLNGLISSSIYAVAILITVTIVMRFKVSANIFIVVPVCAVSGFLGGTVSANT